MGISPRGLQVAYSLDRGLVTGRSIQRELDRNFCRKWVISQEKAWERMLKVGEGGCMYYCAYFKSKHVLLTYFNMAHFFCCRYCNPY